MDMQEAQQLFINEAEELLETMESCLLEVESGEVPVVQHIDAIFRAAHTIKGSAGLFGFDDIVAFTHLVESVLDKVRDRKLEFDEAMASLMLDCQQHMNQLIQALADTDKVADKNLGTELLTRLNIYLHPNQTVVVLDESLVEPDPIKLSHWMVNIVYGEDVFRDGMDPSSQLHFLQTLGNIVGVSLTLRLPETGFDAESCYFDLHVELQADVDKQKIEDVFEFIQDSCKISISSPSLIAEKIKNYAEDTDRIGEVLVNSGAVTPRELEKVLSLQRSALQENRQVDNIGSMLIKQGSVDQNIVNAALGTQKHLEHKRPVDLQFLKVDARKLDNLIGLIGELVTAGAANELLVRLLDSEKMDESFSAMVLLIEQIRDSALSLRMVPIGESFGRLKRIVRDVTKELGKDIQLDVQGAETELDKSMVEKLSDPLMHLVRNAIDHGIEQQDVRQYKGKSATGRLGLNAYHEAGAVVIEIKDDGAGLNAEKVRSKAVEKGLINEDHILSKEEIYKLIFEAGFSTAQNVTNISGRGVGMDVVKRNIEELRGQISVESELDRGTTFRIRLPLTLAIIDGFEVSVGDSSLVIPVNMIQECMVFDPDQLAIERHYINLRGEVLPFVRVREILRIERVDNKKEHIVVVQFGDKKAGLVVEDLRGELQAVIKPLNEMFRAIKGIGGSTILGSGEIGFILDVPQLIEFARQKESRHCASEAEKSEKVSYE
ncbi:chemotaxis protein CheA [Paraglaciecola sp.]|uniref:chemotaxis protein CheA n=1 Tax=Paraglaciecola sp. TaxID=1920173 RepID=UPI0030F43DB8